MNVSGEYTASIFLSILNTEAASIMTHTPSTETFTACHISHNETVSQDERVVEQTGISWRLKIPQSVMSYLSILLQLVLEFIFTCLPSSMQQYQDLKFITTHCTLYRQQQAYQKRQYI
jgi:hypothetical protein